MRAYPKKLMSFFDWNQFLGKRTSKKLANNTYVEKIDSNTIGIRYHRTHVVQVRSDDTYRLTTNGWTTPTTKVRLNKYSPLNIWQKNFEWFYSHNGEDKSFYDGMIVDRAGNPVSV